MCVAVPQYSFPSCTSCVCVCHHHCRQAMGLVLRPAPTTSSKSFASTEGCRGGGFVSADQAQTCRLVSLSSWKKKVSSSFLFAIIQIWHNIIQSSNCMSLFEDAGSQEVNWPVVCEWDWILTPPMLCYSIGGDGNLTNITTLPSKKTLTVLVFITRVWQRSVRPCLSVKLPAWPCVKPYGNSL